MKKLFVYIAVLIFLVACKKEEQVSLCLDVTNPCAGAKEISAEFTIGELTSSIPSWSDTTFTDTIFKNKNVHFNALEEDADYTWYVGTEVLNEKSFTRYFDASLVGTTQTISLVVRKEPNSVCLPNDDGYDSISKTLYVSQYIIQDGDSVYLGSIEGGYRVYMEHISDSADVFVNVSRGAMSQLFFNIYNYDGYGSNCVNTTIYGGCNYREVFTKYSLNTYACDHLEGSVHNVLGGQVEMNFTFRDTSINEFYERIYKGRKL